MIAGDGQRGCWCRWPWGCLWSSCTPCRWHLSSPAETSVSDDSQWVGFWLCADRGAEQWTISRCFMMFLGVWLNINFSDHCMSFWWGSDLPDTADTTERRAKARKTLLIPSHDIPLPGFHVSSYGVCLQLRNPQISKKHIPWVQNAMILAYLCIFCPMQPTFWWILARNLSSETFVLLAAPRPGKESGPCSHNGAASVEVWSSEAYCLRCGWWWEFHRISAWHGRLMGDSWEN